MKCNLDIRSQIFMNGLKNYQVAERVGVNDSTFSKWLRTELNDERKARVQKAIDELVKERKEVQ